MNFIVVLYIRRPTVKMSSCDNLVQSSECVDPNVITLDSIKLRSTKKQCVFLTMSVHLV